MRVVTGPPALLWYNRNVSNNDQSQPSTVYQNVCCNRKSDVRGTCCLTCIHGIDMHLARKSPAMPVRLQAVLVHDLALLDEAHAAAPQGSPKSSSLKVFSSVLQQAAGHHML